MEPSPNITQVEAQKVRGRMQFAESQIYGRTGKRRIAALKDFSCRRRSRISERDATFLKLFLDLLKSEDPRTISLQQHNSVVVITDACYEKVSRDWVCGLGGVLVDNVVNARLYFSLQLSEEQRVLLGELRKRQIIFEAETLWVFFSLLPVDANLRRQTVFLVRWQRRDEVLSHERILRKSYSGCNDSIVCWVWKQSENGLLVSSCELFQQHSWWTFQRWLPFVGWDEIFKCFRPSREVSWINMRAHF